MQILAEGKCILKIMLYVELVFANYVSRFFSAVTWTRDLSECMIGQQLLFEQAWKHGIDPSMLESQTWSSLEQLDVIVSLRQAR